MIYLNKKTNTGFQYICSVWLQGKRMSEFVHAKTKESALPVSKQGDRIWVEKSQPKGLIFLSTICSGVLRPKLGQRHPPITWNR